MTTTQVLTVTELSELPSLHGETPPAPRDDPILQVPVPDSDSPGRTLGAAAPREFGITPFHGVSRTKRVVAISLVMCVNFIQFISNFTTVAGGFEFSEKLGREAGPGQANWLAAAYSLTQGAFVLISGRLGTIYGHQTALLCGGAIFTVFSFANAFCTNYTAFVAARALTGVGGGILMPNAVAIITVMIPPGYWRNITMSCFGASAPIGGFFGALLTGVFLERTHWRWLFIFLAASQAATLAGIYLSMPKDEPLDRGGKIDYVGAALGLGSLILFSFVWNQAPSSGWQTPVEIVCLILSVVLFALFLLWEGKFAKEPVMPLFIFKTPSFSPLVLVVTLSYMSFAIAQWYAITWLQIERRWSVLDTAVGYTPFLVVGPLSVFLAAWLLPRLAAQWIMAMGIVVLVAANLLVATMPVQQTYWAQAFPAIVLYCLSPDFVYVAAQLIVSNSVGRKYQGVAGSLIGTLNLYGNSLGIGVSGTVESQVAKNSGDRILGYRTALYFGFAVAVLALALDVFLVRVPKDNREGWDSSDDVEDSLIVGTGRSVEPAHAATQRR